MKEVSLKKQIYLMPLTPVSMLLCGMLGDAGADVLGYCDNDPGLQSKKFLRKSIFLPKDAYLKNPDAAVIICEIKYFSINEKQLREIGFGEIHRATDLKIDGDLAQYASRLDIDACLKMIPRQAGFAEFIRGAASVLKRWDLLAAELRDRHQERYAVDEPCLLTKSGGNDEGQTRFLICINATRGSVEYLPECLLSLKAQTYTNYSVLVLQAAKTQGTVKETNKTVKIAYAGFLTAAKPVCNIDAISLIWSWFPNRAEYDYIVTLGADDTLSKDALSVLADKTAECNTHQIFTADEDRIYENAYIAPYYKAEYRTYRLLGIRELLRNLICVSARYSGNIASADIDDVCVIDRVLYHYRIIENSGDDLQVKLIAFYLPQFHAIPENDEWWGEGFTEWANVKRARPMFDSHYQPRVPDGLGYYDLVRDKDMQKKQMRLAKKHGIFGFCYYYYWFGGKRLLEKPLDRVLDDPELDMPFCICWANENWTRRWDGRANEVLIEQKHDEESDRRFFRDILPILSDTRYIRINGSPLLLVYRCDLFLDFGKTVETWRGMAKENGLDNIHISVIDTFGYLSTAFNCLGCDSATEFQGRLSLLPIKDKLSGLAAGFSGYIYGYEDYMLRAMNKRCPDHLCFRGGMTGYDNTARRLNDATICHGSTPELYKKLLISLVDFTSRNREEERFIFINAWNEWAESNYLEPDERYGDAYLRATGEAISINC